MNFIYTNPKTYPEQRNPPAPHYNAVRKTICKGKKRLALIYTPHNSDHSDPIPSLSRRDQLALLDSIMHPPTSERLAPALLRVLLDARLELGAEVADETLDRPCYRTKSLV